jgi:hypothetical protein
MTLRHDHTCLPALVSTVVISLGAWVIAIFAATAVSAHASSPVTGPVMLGAYGYVSPEWAARFRFNYARGAFSPARFPEDYHEALRTHQRVVADLIRSRPGVPAGVLCRGMDKHWPLLVADAAAWSEASARHGNVIGVQLDDFVSNYRRMLAHGADGPRLMAELAVATASGDERLPLGITLYEDELTEDDDVFRRGPHQVDLGPIRARIGLVAFYLHNRESAQGLRDRVAAVHRRFPNARIVGGIYVNDRRKYEASYFGRTSAMDEAGEQALFRRHLELAWSLTKEGTLSGLELFPTAYGTEEDLRNQRKMTVEEFDVYLRHRDMALRFFRETIHGAGHTGQGQRRDIQ